MANYGIQAKSDHDLRVFGTWTKNGLEIFFSGREGKKKNQSKNSILWHMMIILSSNFSVQN